MTQAEALRIMKTGVNVFLTGEPGSGKTHTINCYVRYLRSCGIEPAITASTGIAATHISGMTIHSWSGIGIKRQLTEYDLDAISQNERVVRRVSRTKVLIIDEVSMLSAATLSMVDEVCRNLRHSNEPFGGLQILLVGDFFQLPPVVRKEEHENDMRLAFENSEDDTSAQFAYRASVWKDARMVICYLSEQHRQEDAAFLEILKGIRLGEVTSSHRVLLQKRYVGKKGTPEKITTLFPHNADVDRINEVEIKKLSGESCVFEMKGMGAPAVVASLIRSCLSPERLTLKVGAKVLFTKNNIERGFVNGTLGEVVSFNEPQNIPLVKTQEGRLIEAEPMEWAVEAEGRVLGRITQVPLRLAWAITVHKSQGMSLDAVLIDLSQSFEYGQGYVALSRVRTLEGLHLLGMNERALEVHPETLEKDTAFREESEAARETFGRISEKEIQTMHHDFIVVCGGEPKSESDSRKSTLISSKRKRTKGTTLDQTHTLLNEKKTVSEIAHLRGFTEQTILSHIEDLLELKKITEETICHLREGIETDIAAIEKAFLAVGGDKLRPVYDFLGGKYSFNTIRIARLFSKKSLSSF